MDQERPPNPKEQEQITPAQQLNPPSTNQNQNIIPPNQQQPYQQQPYQQQPSYYQHPQPYYGPGQPPPQQQPPSQYGYKPPNQYQGAPPPNYQQQPPNYAQIPPSYQGQYGSPPPNQYQNPPYRQPPPYSNVQQPPPLRPYNHEAQPFLQPVQQFQLRQNCDGQYSPVEFYCTRCKGKRVSVLKYEPGLWTWICCFSLFLGTIILGLLPFFLKDCQNAKHICPSCSGYVGKKNFEIC